MRLCMTLPGDHADKELFMIAYALAFVFGFYSFTSSVDFKDRTFFNCPEILSGREDLYFYNKEQIVKMVEFCSYDETKHSRI